MKKRVSFITLGCKVNQYETNAMMQKFQENGYEIVEIDDVSDICVVNTCTVTNMSDRKSRQALRKVKDKNERCNNSSNRLLCSKFKRRTREDA